MDRLPFLARLLLLLLVAGTSAQPGGTAAAPACRPELFPTEVAVYSAAREPTARCCAALVAPVHVGSGGVSCLCLLARDSQLVEAALNATELISLYVSCGEIPSGDAHLPVGCEGPPPPPPVALPPPPPPVVVKTPPPQPPVVETTMPPPPVVATTPPPPPPVVETTTPPPASDLETRQSPVDASTPAQQLHSMLREVTMVFLGLIIFIALVVLMGIAVVALCGCWISLVLRGGALRLRVVPPPAGAVIPPVQPQGMVQPPPRGFTPPTSAPRLLPRVL